MTGGLLNIGKPQGLTSFQVIARIRRILDEKRVGHCGTLDPLATGVLLVLYGKATVKSEELMRGDKVYRAVMKLGIRTDSGDITGKVLEDRPVSQISLAQIEAAFERFLGESDQIPPMYSAVKLRGKKLYQYAREGLDVERPPRKIRIDSFKILHHEFDEINLRIRCSKGTYVRALIEDLGKAMGYPATMKSLVRERSGPFKIQDSIPWNDVLGMSRETLLSKSILPQIQICVPS